MANRKLNSIKFPDIADTYILDADKVNYDDSETYASGSVGKALQNKANIDGSYEDLTAGTANQINTSVRANDKTPYIFRTSGGSVDIGDREYINGIAGGTVAWNQIVQNGDFADTTGWTGAGDISISASGNALTATVGGSIGSMYYGVRKTTNFSASTNGHKIFITADINAPYSGAGIGVLNSTGASNQYTGVANTWSTVCTILNFGTGDHQLQIYVGAQYASYVANDTFKIRNCMCFDLTQMFGSTIADYIYSLETATAGAGVAWFKKLFPKPYYAYNAGELKSVSGLVSHDMTGFNQWDEEWEVGYYDNSTGEKATGSSTIRSKNYIPVIPSATYYFKSPNGVFAYFYGASKEFLGAHGGGTRIVNNSISLGANVHYIRFSVPSEYGTTYKNDICINISWDGSRDGEYEPYVKHSYPLDSDLTLRGIPKLDANNNLYYDGDVYESDGTVTRKYGIVDLGTLSYGYNSSYGFYCSTPSYMKNPNNNYAFANIACSKYSTQTVAHVVDGSTDKAIAVGSYIYIADSAYTDATAFKTAMNGIYLVYELATPTTETADAYQHIEIVNDFGTEEFVIDSDIAVPIPVGTDTDYPVNLVAKLEMAPNSPEGNGDYIVRQVNGENSYVPLVIEDALPTIPSTAGSYKLTVTVADGSDPVLSWEAE